MTDNQFDNFFREKLRDHTAPVPEGLWERIRPEKEKRPKGFFLPKINGTGFMVAALLVGTVLIGLFTYQQQNAVPATDSAANNQSKITNNNSSSNLNSNPSENNSTLAPVSNSNQTTQESSKAQTNVLSTSSNSQLPSNAEKTMLVLNKPSAFSNTNASEKSRPVSNNNVTDNQVIESDNNALYEPNYVSAHVQQSNPYFLLLHQPRVQYRKIWQQMVMINL